MADGDIYSAPRKDMGHITTACVADPDSLEKILRALNAEVDAIRYNVNELVVDHSTQVMSNSNLRSAMVEIVTDMSGFVASNDSLQLEISTLGSNFMSAMTRLTTDAKLSSVSTVTYTSTALTAAPAVLTNSTTTSGAAALTYSSVVADRVTFATDSAISGGTPQ